MPLLCARRDYHLPFYRNISGLTMSPLPLVVLCDGFMPAGIARRGSRPARHLADPDSSCLKCEVERLSPSVSIPIHLALSLDLLTLVSLPHKRDVCCMLRASSDRDDGSAPSS
jgi:hypothetical protein